MALIKLKNVNEIPKIRPFRKSSTNKLYFQDEDNVVKIFLDCYRPLDLKSGRDMLKLLVVLMELKESKSLVLPKDIYITDTEILGYRTEFVNAPSIGYISRNIRLIDLLQAYKNVLEDVRLLSNMRINFLDINEGSLLYKDDNIYLLDFDLSKFNNVAKEDSIYAYNAYKIWQQVLRSIFLNKEPYSLYDILNYLHIRDFDRGALDCGIMSIEQSLENFYLSLEKALAVDNKTCLNDIDLQLRRIKNGH